MIKYRYQVISRKMIISKYSFHFAGRQKFQSCHLLFCHRLKGCKASVQNWSDSFMSTVVCVCLTQQVGG